MCGRQDIHGWALVSGCMQADGVSLGSTVSQLTGVLVSKMARCEKPAFWSSENNPVQALSLYCMYKVYRTCTGLCAPRTIYWPQPLGLPDLRLQKLGHSGGKWPYRETYSGSSTEY